MSEANRGSNVASVIDAMNISESEVEAEAAKFNEDGSPKPDAAAKTEQASPGGEGGGEGGEGGEQQRVLSKDGKHTLPFTVVEEARQRAADADREKDEALARATALEAKLKELTTAAAGGEQSQAEQDKTKGDIAAIKGEIDVFREDHPALAGLFEKVTGLVENLQSQVEAHNQTEAERQRDQDARATAANAEITRRVGEAIDNNATLTLWKAEDKDAFNQAVAFDEVLKKQPAWKGKSFDERFKRAVELTIIEMPGAKKPTTTLTADELKARAEAVLKKAEGGAASGTTIDSLSDLPGGASPGADALENLEAMPAAALANRMGQMSDAQLLAFMEKHG